MITLDSAKQWDQLDFHYQAIDSDAETTLPFKLLVLGDFTLSDDQRPVHLIKPVNIDGKIFDRILAAQSICIETELALATQDSELEYIDLSIDITSMADFEPPALVNKVDYLRQHNLLMNRVNEVVQPGFTSADFNDNELKLLSQCGVAIEHLNTTELPFVIADINEHLYEMLDLILHQGKFQKLESIWRNLQQLVDCANDVEHCEIHLLDISQHQIMEDFEANRDIRDSLLFDVVYLQEFAQYGGHPYTAMVADYEFSAGAQDIALLRSLGTVANAAHAPIIAGISPKFFGHEDFSSLASAGDLEELISSPKYIKWRGLQQSTVSSYIGLAMPRIQLRNGYTYAAGSLAPMPYQEDTRLSASKVLLGNASFAFGRCLVNSFAKYGVCTDISGPEGGRVLPACHSAEQSHFPNYPIECVLSENKVAQLGQLGLLALSLNQYAHELIFNLASSIRWGSLTIPMMRSSEEMLNAQVEAQLPYLFIISRIAHYIKVVERDNVGSLKNVSEVQSELNRWLRRYVSDVENPAPGVRARKPLKKAEVVLIDSDNEGRHHLSLTVTPHMKYMGNDFTLALDISAQ